MILSCARLCVRLLLYGMLAWLGPWACCMCMLASVIWYMRARCAMRCRCHSAIAGRNDLVRIWLDRVDVGSGGRKGLTSKH